MRTEDCSECKHFKYAQERTITNAFDIRAHDATAYLQGLRDSLRDMASYGGVSLGHTFERRHPLHDDLGMLVREDIPALAAVLADSVSLLTVGSKGTGKCILPKDLGDYGVKVGARRHPDSISMCRPADEPLYMAQYGEDLREAVRLWARTPMSFASGIFYIFGQCNEQSLLATAPKFVCPHGVVVHIDPLDWPKVSV